MKEINSISFIGSGNVATRLAVALYSKGIRIDCILSPTLENANMLAKKVKAFGTNQLEKLPMESDLYVISLKDDVIEAYLKDLRLNNKLVAHTSGSFETSKLGSISNNTGCFYPLQTFDKEVDINFENIPIIIESKNLDTVNLLSGLAKKVSNNIHILTAEQKVALHISAIGINNFTHFILSKSKSYCIDKNLDFNLLKPLLKQTINLFLNESNPIEKQTGPARRGDLSIINNHLEALSENKDFQSLYKDLSQYILSEFHGEKFKL